MVRGASIWLVGFLGVLGCKGGAGDGGDDGVDGVGTETEEGEDLADVMRSFGGWPAAGEAAMLIWFERELDYKELVPTPEEMQAFISLTITFAGRYGDVYLMEVGQLKNDP